MLVHTFFLSWNALNIKIVIAYFSKSEIIRTFDRLYNGFYDLDKKNLWTIIIFFFFCNRVILLKYMHWLSPYFPTILVYGKYKLY